MSSQPLVLCTKPMIVSKSNGGKLWPQQMVIHWKNQLSLLSVKPLLTYFQLINIGLGMKSWIQISRYHYIQALLKTWPLSTKFRFCLHCPLWRSMGDIHEPSVDQLWLIFKVRSGAIIWSIMLHKCVPHVSWTKFASFLYDTLFLKEYTLVL